jgi:hypothetical protein
MALNFPDAPGQYGKPHQDQVQRLLEIEDKKNVKTGQILDKLLFRDTATGLVKTVVVTSGALVIS